ncbi:MAG: metallo-mystery pair system four-Cys motif protein [Elainella sp. Prado103]|jgi:hypothetical protein|nr:metallo-mystery pair system four-Cys motif protein [Elainella sp. Prado103]
MVRLFPFDHAILMLGATATGWLAIHQPTVALDSIAQTADQPVTLRFSAQVGDQPFQCGDRYPLGHSGVVTTPTDFRFYISDVALMNATGERVPLVLQQDGRWQHDQVALLDFENKTGACTNGTVETRDQVVGTVPTGNYQGLEFTLGVPFSLNHADATLAASPLNLTSLWWNWRGGYKFLRIDLLPQTLGSRPTQLQPIPWLRMDASSHSLLQGISSFKSSHFLSHALSQDLAHRSSHQSFQNLSSISSHRSPHESPHESSHDPFPWQERPSSYFSHGTATDQTPGFAIHLGSTGCQASETNQAPITCTQPNRVTVRFDGFDPARQRVVADLAALVATTDLTINQPNTPVGCMSSPDDQDCAGIMGALGLNSSQTSGAQTFFRVE